jgi:hypothetical protein
MMNHWFEIAQSDPGILRRDILTAWDHKISATHEDRYHCRGCGKKWEKIRSLPHCVDGWNEVF